MSSTVVQTAQVAAPPPPKSLRGVIKGIVRKCGYEIVPNVAYQKYPRDFSEREIQIIRAVEPYTMTTPEKLFALIQAVRYVVHNEIPGDIVECGVWRGGSMMAIAKTLLEQNCRDRELHLFDTFEGMSAPTEEDVFYDGSSAFDKFEATKISDASSTWCSSSLENVTQVMYSTGYDRDKIHFAKGMVEDTLPEQAPQQIALLRLDTDWYESTKHELEHLFPRLAPQGVLILDDYGSWDGARKAVDEYIAQNQLCLLLNRIDVAGRIGIKAA